MLTSGHSMVHIDRSYLHIDASHHDMEAPHGSEPEGRHYYPYRFGSRDHRLFYWPVPVLLQNEFHP